jgi:cell division protein FtsB
VKAQKETLLANNKEIASLNAKIDKTVKQNQASELEIKKLQNDIEKVSVGLIRRHRKVISSTGLTPLHSSSV